MPMQLLSEEFRAEFTPFDSAPFGKPHERYDAAPHPTREVFCRSFVHGPTIAGSSAAGKGERARGAPFYKMSHFVES